MITYLSHVYSS